jgi:hypothetical protein
MTLSAAFCAVALGKNEIDEQPATLRKVTISSQALIRTQFCVFCVFCAPRTLDFIFAFMVE